MNFLEPTKEQQAEFDQVVRAHAEALSLIWDNLQASGVTDGVILYYQEDPEPALIGTDRTRFFSELRSPGAQAAGATLMPQPASQMEPATDEAIWFLVIRMNMAARLTREQLTKGVPE